MKMPYKRKNMRRKKAFRKRRGNRKYRKASKISSLTLRTPSFIPDQMRVKLRYNSIVSIAPGVPAGGYIFRGNSCFDPDFSGVGKQPLGFDQWANMYNKYRVRASKIVIQLSNTNTTVPASVSLYPSEDASLPGTIEGALSQPYSKQKISGIASSTPNLTLTHYMSSKKMLGVKSIEMADEFAAFTTADPTNEWFWIIFVANLSTAGVVTFQGLVKITYYVEFFDRVLQDIS